MDRKQNNELPPTAPIPATESSDAFGRLYTLHAGEVSTQLESLMPPAGTEMTYPNGIIDLASLEDSAAESVEDSMLTPIDGNEPILNTWEQSTAPNPNEHDEAPAKPVYSELKKSVAKLTLEELLRCSVQAEVAGNLDVSAIVDHEFSKRIHDIKQATGDLMSVKDIFLKRKQLADELWNERIKNEDILPVISTIEANPSAPTLPSAEAQVINEVDNDIETVPKEQDSLLAIAQKWQASKGEPEVIEGAQQPIKEYLKQIYADLENGVDPLKDLTNPDEIQQVISLINTYMKDYLKKDDGSSVEPETANNLSYALQQSALEKFRPADVPRKSIEDGPSLSVDKTPKPEVIQTTGNVLRTIAEKWDKDGRVTDFLKENSQVINDQLNRIVKANKEDKNPLEGLKPAEVQPVLDLLGNYLAKVFTFKGEHGRQERLSVAAINSLVGELKRKASKS